MGTVHPFSYGNTDLTDRKFHREEHAFWANFDTRGDLTSDR